MEKYHFLGTLLIPAPEFSGNDFRWIDTVNATSDKGNTARVYILAFNTKEKRGIKPLLECELRRLHQLDTPEEIDTHNMAFIETTLRELESGVHEHKAPSPLMKAVSNSAGRKFTAEDVIYLSGITNISR